MSCKLTIILERGVSCYYMQVVHGAERMSAKEQSRALTRHEAKPFTVVAAHSFDSGTLVFREPEQADIPQVILLDFHERVIRFSTPRS